MMPFSTNSPLSRDLLEALVQHLAGRAWSVGYLDTIASSDAGGAVTGANEHFEALRSLARAELADTPIPPRFCTPSGFDE